MQTHEIRRRKHERGFHMISDAVSSGKFWYLEARHTISYAHYRSRSHDATIHVYDETGNVAELHEHMIEFKDP